MCGRLIEFKKATKIADFIFLNFYRTWTNSYKEMLDGLLNGTEKLPAIISDFKDYNTDRTVKFIITMEKVGLQCWSSQGQNIINLSCVAKLPTLGSNLKIKEGFESVIQIWTDGR